MTGTDYLIGDIVCHASYGHGKVVETGGVLGTVIKVRFGKVEKRLLPSMAPLEKIASAEEEDPADLDELVALLRLENGDDDETTATVNSTRPRKTKAV